mgnify:CR=1 FL=1
MATNWYERYLLPRLLDWSCGVKPIRRQRQKVVPRAEGDVLEVGIGTALNAPFYDKARVRRIVGVDPAQQMHPMALRRIREAGLTVELVGLSAERLPLEDASFDSVVCTYTLCSIPEPARALAEIRRVLRPGGKLLFSDLSVDPSTGQVTLRAEVPNPKGLLLPGLYVRVRLEQAQLPAGILLPQQAVQRGSGGDVVLLVGAAAFRYYPHIPGPVLPEGTELIHITDDPHEAARAPVGTALVGEIKAALATLVERIPAAERAAPQPRSRPAHHTATKPIEPGYVFQCLREVMPDDVLFTEESASTRANFYDQVRLDQPASYFATASGGLGFAMPAAVGVALARPGKTVCCPIGDGAALFGIQALWTAAQHRLEQALRMRHHAEDATARIADPGDVVLCAVGIGLGRGVAARVRVAEHHAALVFELLQRCGIREVVAVAVRHGNADHLALLVAPRVDRVGLLHLEVHVAADELQRCIAHQHTRQQAGFRENLEAVADAEHGRARLGLCDHVAHDRRMGRHGPAAQVVAVRETARQHDEVGGRHAGLPVPHHARRPAEHGVQRHLHVAVAVVSGKYDDGCTHGRAPQLVWGSTRNEARKLSITCLLASNWSLVARAKRR